jgi:hypothetical protein
MNGVVERMWKETSRGLICANLAERVYGEENNEHPHSGQSMSLSRFEPGVTALANTVGDLGHKINPFRQFTLTEYQESSWGK